MPLEAIVLLFIAGWAVYNAYKNEKLGAALLVGVAVLGVLYLLLDHDESAEVAPKPTSSTAVPTQTSATPEAAPSKTTQEESSGTR
jgi:hypothetical protein